MYQLPVNISFELTDTCNNNCSHCYASSWIKTEESKKDNVAISVAKCLAEYEVFDIILEAVERIVYDNLRIHFENIPFRIQKGVVDKINSAAEKIKTKTSQIAQLFF